MDRDDEPCEIDGLDRMRVEGRCLDVRRLGPFLVFVTDRGLDFCLIGAAAAQYAHYLREMLCPPRAEALVITPLEPPPCRHRTPPTP